MTRTTSLLRLRGAVADHSSPSSLAARMRDHRWDLFLQRFPDVGAMRVLDLGGTCGAWRAAKARPGHVTLLNSEDQGPGQEDWLTVVTGDACDPPGEVRGQAFDLVYSNSTIEHVGGHAKRAAFARVVRDAAPHHWVQTPNRYFPIEPHWLFPGFQFLPVPARSFVSRNWPFGWYSRRGEDRATVVEGVLEIELLGTTEMQQYFPDSEILPERLLGLTKSLVAVR
jgi:hypothetical protein